MLPLQWSQYKVNRDSLKVFHVRTGSCLRSGVFVLSESYYIGKQLI